MTTESEILSEVDGLKAKLSDTRALYREVCVLLFFRHGITPTANKLYQYVRRGSMNVPTEELAKFWDDMRHKARVDIEHPDLPDEVKALAAEAIADLWRRASDAARAELAAVRLELQADGERARQAQATAELEVRQARERLQLAQAELAQRDQSNQAARAELEAERRDHAGTQARVQELQTQLERAHVQRQRQQEAFSADLAKGREAIESAQERAAAAERRALLEIEQERQARARADKAVEMMREKLSEAEGRERQKSLELAETATRLQMELRTTTAALAQAQEATAGLQQEVVSLRRQLSESGQDAARHRAEAQTLKGLLDQLTAATAVESKPPMRTTRKKVGRLGP